MGDKIVWYFIGREYEYDSMNMLHFLTHVNEWETHGHHGSTERPSVCICVKLIDKLWGTKYLVFYYMFFHLIKQFAGKRISFYFYTIILIYLLQKFLNTKLKYIYHMFVNKS